MSSNYCIVRFPCAFPNDFRRAIHANKTDVCPLVSHQTDAYVCPRVVVLIEFIIRSTALLLVDLSFLPHCLPCLPGRLLPFSQKVIRLTVDQRHDGGDRAPPPTTDDEANGALVPPLDLVIRTRWPGAAVDWNGSDPIL